MSENRPVGSPEGESTAEKTVETTVEATTEGDFVSISGTVDSVIKLLDALRGTSQTLTGVLLEESIAPFDTKLLATEICTAIREEMRAGRSMA